MPMLRRPLLLIALLVSGCVPTAGGVEFSCGSADGAAIAGREVFRPGAVTVAAVGDVLMHILLQEDAAAQPSGYAAQVVHMAPYLQMADVTVANLEGPAARNVLPGGREGDVAPGVIYDGQIYSGYPTFNYHPSLIPALRGAGVDVLQTANNHAMDRGPLGVDRTLAAIDAAGLAHTGSRTRGAAGPWHTVVEAGGQRIAFLACSYSTNGHPDPAGQILLCYDDEAEVLADIRALAADPQVGAVIFLPHWGTEYVATPNANQRRLARAALEAGAAAVIGTHPHVLQPIEPYRTADGRDAFIAYSLGNFIASQWELPQRTSALLLFDLVPGPQGLEARMPAYLPTRVTRYVSGIIVQPAEQAVDGEQSVAHAAQVLGREGLLSLADMARLQGRAACPRGG
ncbi:CapA family protein [Nioella nitratireducens]|uniref:CapA family protein n=1 Tax=Nioella nitratireducens TaxID=1287720 RepID=UPI0008FD8173|nr:CapA family protein [Nioella nitratireducens]